jgi:hypothetical protein
MKNALLMIPNKGFKLNKYVYLADCIKQVRADDLNIHAPAIYEMLFTVDYNARINSILPFCDIVFMFVDFGIDNLMFSVIERTVAAGKEIKYLRLLKRSRATNYITPLKVLMEVSVKLDISIEELTSKTRKREVVDARFVYFRRAKEVTKASLAAIGRPVKKDHASVLHGIKEAKRTSNVIDLYNECYGETKIKCAPLAQKTTRITAEFQPVERPVLPYRSLDPREQNISTAESSVQAMQGIGIYCGLGSG